MGFGIGRRCARLPVVPVTRAVRALVARPVRLLDWRLDHQPLIQPRLAVHASDVPANETRPVDHAREELSLHDLAAKVRGVVDKQRVQLQPLGAGGVHELHEPVEAEFAFLPDAAVVPGHPQVAQLMRVGGGIPAQTRRRPPPLRR